MSWGKGNLIIITNEADLQRRVLAAHQEGLADPNSAIAKQLQTVIPEVKFDGVTFSDALQFVSDISKLKISPDWDALTKAGIDKSTPLFVQIKNASISTILDVMLDHASEGHTTLVYSATADGVAVVPLVDPLPKTRVDTAQRLLTIADGYAAFGYAAGASKTYNQILSSYPATPAAASAKTNLKNLDAHH